MESDHLLGLFVDKFRRYLVGLYDLGIELLIVGRW